MEVDKIAKVLGGRKCGSGWTARCPAHDDKKASLSISVGHDGSILLHCHACCETADILKAAGLSFPDLFDEKHRGAAQREIASYDYCDENGALLYQVVRYFPKDFRQRRPDGNGGWRWGLGDVRRVLYRLPALVASTGCVYIAEGEKDVEALVKLGLAATTNSGGARKWRDDHNEYLRGRDVVILPDNDEAGRGHATVIANGLRLMAKSVRVLNLPGLGNKEDVSDWINRGGTAEQLLQLAGAAPEATDMVADQGGAEAHAPSDDHPEINPDGKPLFHVDHTDLPRSACAIRDMFAKSGRFFDRDGPAQVVLSSDGGPPTIMPLRPNNVIREVHRTHQPVKRRKDGWAETTLPERVANMYLDMAGEHELPSLSGVTTSPLLGADGSIKTVEGYHPETALWCSGVTNVAPMVPMMPTCEQAQAALALIRDSFKTFPFADANLIWDNTLSLDVVDTSVAPGADESALLVGLLTAVCRSSLWVAPGLMINAPAISGAGSGKGLLIRAICTIAFGCQPKAFTAGSEKHELDKRLTAELIGAAPAIFLDNANGTTLSSSTLASAMTERPARIRILGESRMVELNSTAFIAATGNALMPSGDLARRLIICGLDAHCEDPEARMFPGDFLKELTQRRIELLTAALTIWRWGRVAKDVRHGRPLGSFTTWSEWCRDPLISLGCKDPVERIAEAKARDPRRQHIAAVFGKWWEHHEAKPVRATDLHEDVVALIDPQHRGRQYVASEVGKLSETRVAGFVLSRQKGAGRWGAATYQLAQTGDKANGACTPDGHRGHRGHGTVEPWTSPFDAPYAPYADEQSGTPTVGGLVADECPNLPMDSTPSDNIRERNDRPSGLLPGQEVEF